MKKLVILAGIAAAIATPAAAAPGNSSQASGAATATVIAPITLTHTSTAALNFGSFTAGTAAGSITVDQAGVGSEGGDATLLSTAVTAADEFVVTGDVGRAYSISAAGGTVNRTGGGSMTFTVDAPTGGTIVSGGTTFNVGGTLSVGANQTPGVYTGTYAVTATYN